MIITGIKNKLLILNDSDLSTIKEIEHSYLFLRSVIYNKEIDMIYLGISINLIEFDHKQLVIKR